MPDSDDRALVLCDRAALRPRRPGAKSAFRNVRIGFPPGPHTRRPKRRCRPASPMYKAGAWTPIIVDVQNTGRYDPATDGPDRVG